MMTSVLSSLSDKVYAAIRIVTGLLFSFHGMQKVFGILWPGAYPRPEVGFNQTYIGGWIELVTGLMIAAGLCTRPAAFLASGTMAVAYWQFHVFAQTALTGLAKYLPATNQGTPAVLYCFLFFYMVFKGAGPWSVDARCEKEAS